MVYVEIGESRVPQEQATEGWIAEQLRRRRNDGRAVCVRVRVEARDCNVALSTRECTGVGSNGWTPNPLEKRVIALWEDRVATHRELAPGHVVSFLRQLDAIL